MEHRDHLKNQIDQLGKALAKVLSDLLNLKNSGQSEINRKTTLDNLKDELGFDIAERIHIPTNEFFDTLKKNKNLTPQHFDLLAEILFLMAENRQENSKDLYKKCLMIYTYLEETEDTYSFDRQRKIENVKNKLLN